MEGEQRAHLFALTQSRPFLSGTLLKVNEETPQDGSEIKAYVRALKKEFERYASYIPKISNDVKIKVLSINDCSKLCDFICSNCFLSMKKNRKYLKLFQLRTGL